MDLPIGKKEGIASGVVTADGYEYKGKVVVSNPSAHSTFGKMPGQEEFLKEYLDSLRCFSGIYCLVPTCGKLHHEAQESLHNASDQQPGTLLWKIQTLNGNPGRLWVCPL
jgi:hypothetical protein